VHTVQDQNAEVVVQCLYVLFKFWICHETVRQLTWKLTAATRDCFVQFSSVH